MEYLYTNLPRYVTITPRSAFANSVVQSGHVLLFSEDGTTLTAKLPDGSFITVGGSGGIDVSDTTADAGDVLEGKVFHDSAGVLTSGTIPVVSGGSVIVPDTAEQLIVSSGGAFVNGSLAVAGDTALVASNIMSGITIFGVTGTAETGSGGTDVSDTTAEAANVLSGKVFHDSTGAVTTGTIPTVSAAIESGSVVVPSGYIASSQSFPVSSGTDVSDTTAQAADVLSGKLFYNSGGTLTSGTIPIHSGGTITPGSSSQTISAGQYLSGAIIISPAGGTDVTLGYINSSQLFQGLAFNGKSAYDSGSTELYSEFYTWNTPSASPSPAPSDQDRVIIISGGQVTSSAKSMTGATLMQGETMIIRSGGKASYCSVQYNGNMYISSGGSAVNTVLSGITGMPAVMIVSNGGIISDIGIDSQFNASRTIIKDFGSMYVSSGGSVNTVIVSSGGYIKVESGGTVNTFTLSLGGRIVGFSGSYVGHSGYLNYNSGGDIYISGGHASRIEIEQAWAEEYSGYHSGLIRGGTIHVGNSGRVEDVQVKGGCTAFIDPTGVIESCTIHGSGTLIVSSGGYALNITSHGEANIIVSSGGYITYKS